MKFRLNKEERNKTIDYLEQMCDKTPFTHKTLGVLFRSFHLNVPPVCLYAVIFGDTYFVIFALIVLFFSYICWIPFNGCFLSMLENRICKDDFTIADPFLELLQKEKNSKNRMNISYVVGGSYLLLIISILYIRYYTTIFR